MTSRVDGEAELRDAFESLVALARRSRDPSEVDYALLRLQLVLQTQVTAIAMALDTMARGPDGVGAACYEDVLRIATGKVNGISTVVGELPRLAAERTVVGLPSEQELPAPKHLAREE